MSLAHESLVWWAMRGFEEVQCNDCKWRVIMWKSQLAGFIYGGAILTCPNCHKERDLSTHAVPYGYEMAEWQIELHQNRG